MGSDKAKNIDGRVFFMSRCALCHGRDGKGLLDGRAYAADFTKPGGVLSKSDEELIYSILNGVSGEHGRMPAFSPILTRGQAEIVLGFIRQEFSPSQ